MYIKGEWKVKHYAQGVLLAGGHWTFLHDFEQAFPFASSH